MRKLLISLFTIITVLQLPLFAAANNSNQINCAKEVQPILTKIQQLPEAQGLIKSILQEGPLRITAERTEQSEQFGACWDPDRRIIYVNMSPSRSEGEIIGSILFEMHNASITKKLDHYDHLVMIHKIDKKSYVEMIEFLEYQNSKKAASIAEKGIEKGLFPPAARLHTYRDFDEHFHYQKIGGHSAHIARNYDMLSNA